MGKKITEFEARCILGKIGGFCGNQTIVNVIRSIRDKKSAVEVARAYHIDLTKMDEKQTVAN